MRLFFSTILTLFVSVTSFAVTTINVHVTDKNGNPVPNAKVEVKGVMQWDKDDFCRTYDIDFYDCFAPKGFANPDWQDSCLEKKDVCSEAFHEGLKECGYYEDLETWIAQMHEREGRYKYEDINTDINTDVNGMAHVEVDGYAEYRVAVQGAVRYFKDGVKNISMSVKAGEVIYWVMPIDDFDDFRHFCNIREDGLRRLWNVFVVKSNPYLDIRKHFPNNDTLLQPEDILKYYPEIHDIRVWNEESYDENLLTFCGDINEQWNSSDQKERALFLHLEQGEYQFIFSSDNGEIFIDELNTRTASNIWHRFMWEKFPDDRWLLHYYVRFDPNYKTKTPPDNIQIPTVITPYTQDGLNDDFLPGYEVEIFDYYGNFVCSSANGWDGRKGSDLAPPGIYFYKVTLKDGRKRKGTVEVIKM
ncbi:MAG: gliding motility-associated C-terminal domain-containing protein [Paludibacteraceae bacterium]|nr:gliding motility-associated C-terminal domain-containing protein [Paludibacteraceae bacterium]